MPIRITGMNSGLDTESIITALTQRYQDKVDNTKNDQKKLSWKQDKWKELNKKVVSFYNGTLTNMRFSSAYTKKTTTSSNSSAATIITSNSAMNTTQSLNITQLAKSAYLTGKEVEVNGSKASQDTTIEELGLTEGQKIKFSIGGDSNDVLSVDIESGDTIKSILTKLKSAKSSKTQTALNFNYDENNGRFFVSAKTAGEAAAFDLISDSDSSAAMSALGFEKKADGSNYVKGTKAQIVLNGETFESDSNTFEINGLTITANEVASGISLTTKQDTSGIFDNIKKMLKEYNDLMKEFATAYNADKASKYKMLTDDQKDEMSDDEVEEWEKKIKDSLLSGDETIGDIRNGIKSIINKSFSVTLKDGSTSELSLARFGISTGSYFSTEENERDALHIDGDKDDSLTSGNTDLLTAFISTDPDAVQSFFQQFANSMYSKISDLMKGTTYSSAFTIYEDKLMASQYSEYNSKISKAETALQNAQDKLYSKYSKMETALSKINSSSGSLSGFFGGN